MAASAAFTTWCAPRTASADGAAAPRRLERERGPQLGVERDSVGADVGVGTDGVPTATRTTAAAVRAASPGVAGSSASSTASAVGGERLEQLALHPGDAVAAAEVLGVGEPDVGDDADVGPRDRAQRGDVAGDARAHLQHERLGRRRARRAA